MHQNNIKQRKRKCDSKSRFFSKFRFLIVILLFFGFVLFFYGKLEAVVGQNGPPSSDAPVVSHSVSEVIGSDGQSLQELLQNISLNLSSILSRLDSLEEKMNNLIIDGVCKSDRNECESGNYRPRSSTSTQYRWYCDGINGGTNDSCSKAIHYSTPYYSSPYGSPYGSPNGNSGGSQTPDTNGNSGGSQTPDPYPTPYGTPANPCLINPRLCPNPYSYPTPYGTPANPCLINPSLC